MLTSEEIYALAVELEAEELVGAADEPLAVADIFVVLEILWERGVDLDRARSTRIEPEP